MNAPLRVLLPIRNAKLELIEQVEELLEILSELDPDFQLLIVDDHSADDTWDLIRQLASQYPQIRHTSHPRRLGLGQSIRQAMRMIDPDLVVIGDSLYEFDPADLTVLWELRQIERRVARRARVTRRLADHALDKLTRGQLPGAVDHRGWVVLRRETCEQLQAAANPSAFRLDRPFSPPAPIAPPTSWRPSDIRARTGLP